MKISTQAQILCRFLLMGTQTQVSCQFCRNVFYLCLKHIKSWLVHYFRSIISDLLCAHTQLFILLLIWSFVHIIISPAITAQEEKRREFSLKSHFQASFSPSEYMALGTEGKTQAHIPWSIVITITPSRPTP